MADTVRIGEAAKLLGVRVETLRRWEAEGKITLVRSEGGQRLVPTAVIAKLLAKERKHQLPIASESVRNRFAGVITEVKKDGVMATVEMQAGPFRILAAITREAADDLALAPGMEAVAAMKATNVTIELSERKRRA